MAACMSEEETKLSVLGDIAQLFCGEKSDSPKSPPVDDVVGG